MPRKKNAIISVFDKTNLSNIANFLIKKNLVIIMLRGGMDGLTAVPFIGNNILRNARPDIGVDKPIKITPDFALHPQLKKFKKLWDKNKASVFHATSIPYTGRSHFEGQYLMESGGTVPYYDKTGWLGRALETANKKSLSISLPMPLILRGGKDLDNFMPSANRLPDDETLKILAEAKNCDPSDITVCILERPRHQDMIEQVRSTGAAIRLISDGDVAGVMHCAEAETTGIDMYMGIGGAPEGVLAAAALKCMGGQIHGRLLFRNDDERLRAEKAGLINLSQIYSRDDMVTQDVIFAATGVTSGSLLEGIKREITHITAETILMRSKTGSVRRMIYRVPKK